jgi:hypothetical protein
VAGPPTAADGHQFLCYIIDVDRVVRWYRSARRHRVGKAHAMHVITTTVPEQVPASDLADARLVRIGADDRGIELEIAALGRRGCRDPRHAD